MFTTKNFRMLMLVAIMTTLFAIANKNVFAVGSVPTECTEASISSNNPAGDPVCNSSCNNDGCISYCAAGSTGAEVTISNDINQLKVAYFNAYEPLLLTIPELNINSEVLSCEGRGCIGSAVFDVDVAAGTTIHVSLQQDNGEFGMGFRSPANNICGEDNICSPIGGTYGTFDISGTIAEAQNGGYEVFSPQCWADSAIGDSDFDFNDYGLVLAGKVDAGPGPVCGDGHVDEDLGEECDNGPDNGKACTPPEGKDVSSCTYCSTECKIVTITNEPPRCGDGKVNQPSEACDDGNTVSGDGCSSDCKLEIKPKPTDGDFLSYLWTVVTSWFKRIFK